MSFWLRSLLGGLKDRGVSIGFLMGKLAGGGVATASTGRLLEPRGRPRAALYRHRPLRAARCLRRVRRADLWNLRRGRPTASTGRLLEPRGDAPGQLCTGTDRCEPRGACGGYVGLIYGTFAAGVRRMAYKVAGESGRTTSKSIGNLLERGRRVVARAATAQASLESHVRLGYRQIHLA